MKNSDLVPTQGSVSVSKVDSYVEAIQKGDEIPPIKVDENGVISDGHHRAVAHELLGIKPKTVPGGTPPKFTQRTCDDVIAKSDNQ